MDFAGVQKRYYRGTLDRLQEAIDHWKATDVSFIVQLGDIVDGKCKDNEISEEAFGRTIDLFNQIEVPRFDLIGNHELYNFSMEWILENLNVGDSGYYSHIPCQRWRLL